VSLNHRFSELSAVTFSVTAIEPLLIFFCRPVDVGIRREHPHSRMVFQVSGPELETPTQAEQVEYHFIAPCHLAHDKNDHRDTEQPEQVEIHRKQQAAARSDKKRNIGNAHKHGRTGATSKQYVSSHGILGTQYDPVVVIRR